MWPFKKKPEPGVFDLPKDKHYEFYRLADIVTKAKSADKLAKYELWSFIGELFPDTEEGNWKWQGIIGHVKIIEVL